MRLFGLKSSYKLVQIQDFSGGKVVWQVGRQFLGVGTLQIAVLLFCGSNRFKKAGEYGTFSENIKSA